MIRSENARVSFQDSNGQTVQMSDLYGSSTDTKPTTGLANGSMFVEVDTGKLFLFNEDTGEWSEISTGGGGAENYIETITGTMATLAADLNAAYDSDEKREALMNDLMANNVHIVITIDTEVLGQGKYDLPMTASDVDQLYVGSAAWSWGDETAQLTGSILVNIYVHTETGFDLTKLYTYVDGAVTDVSSYAAALPYELKIFHHPMPTN